MMTKTLAYPPAHPLPRALPRMLAERGAALALAAVMLVWAAGAQARTAPESFADLAAKLLPSVVNISTTQNIEGRPSCRG